MSYLSARRFVSLLLALGILAIPTLVAILTAGPTGCHGTSCGI
jgi:hypothetical protein